MLSQFLFFLLSYQTFNNTSKLLREIVKFQGVLVAMRNEVVLSLMDLATLDYQDSRQQTMGCHQNRYFRHVIVLQTMSVNTMTIHFLQVMQGQIKDRIFFCLNEKKKLTINTGDGHVPNGKKTLLQQLARHVKD